jgi:hypothetical protein
MHQSLAPRKVLAQGHQSNILQDTNWGIALTGNFIDVIYSSTGALLEHRSFADMAVEDVKAKLGMFWSSTRNCAHSIHAPTISPVYHYSNKARPHT